MRKINTIHGYIDIIIRYSLKSFFVGTLLGAIAYISIFYFREERAFQKVTKEAKAFVEWYVEEQFSRITQKRSKPFKKTTHLNTHLTQLGYTAVGGGVLVLLFVSFFIYYKEEDIQFLSGGIVSEKEWLRVAKNYFKKEKWKFRGNIKISEKIPWFDRFHTESMAIWGLPGRGKSVLVDNILEKIKQKEGGVILSWADEVQKHYRPGKDILCDFFDGRTKNWNFFLDFKNNEDYRMAARSLAPDDPNSQKIWTNSARDILVVIFDAIQRQADQENRIPNNQDIRIFCDTYANTPESLLNGLKPYPDLYTKLEGLLASGSDMSTSIIGSVQDALNKFRENNVAQPGEWSLIETLRGIIAENHSITNKVINDLKATHYYQVNLKKVEVNHTPVDLKALLKSYEKTLEPIQELERLQISLKIKKKNQFKHAKTSLLSIVKKLKPLENKIYTNKLQILEELRAFKHSWIPKKWQHSYFWKSYELDLLEGVLKQGTQVLFSWQTPNQSHFTPIEQLFISQHLIEQIIFPENIINFLESLKGICFHSLQELEKQLSEPLADANKFSELIHLIQKAKNKEGLLRIYKAKKNKIFLRSEYILNPKNLALANQTTFTFGTDELNKLLINALTERTFAKFNELPNQSNHSYQKNELIDLMTQQQEETGSLPSNETLSEDDIEWEKLFHNLEVHTNTHLNENEEYEYQITTLTKEQLKKRMIPKELKKQLEKWIEYNEKFSKIYHTKEDFLQSLNLHLTQHLYKNYHVLIVSHATKAEQLSKKTFHTLLTYFGLHDEEFFKRLLAKLTPKEKIRMYQGCWHYSQENQILPTYYEIDETFLQKATYFQVNDEEIHSPLSTDELEFKKIKHYKTQTKKELEAKINSFPFSNEQKRQYKHAIKKEYYIDPISIHNLKPLKGIYHHEAFWNLLKENCDFKDWAWILYCAKKTWLPLEVQRKIRQTHASLETICQLQPFILSDHAILEKLYQDVKSEKTIRQIQKEWNFSISTPKKSMHTDFQKIIKNRVAPYEKSFLFLHATKETKEVSKPIFNLMLSRMVSFINSSQKDDKKRVWFILDEFPELGRMDEIFDSAATQRKRGLCSIIIWQTHSQLENLYERKWQTLLNNLDTHCAFAIKDRTTTEWMLHQIGQAETIQYNDSIQTRNIHQEATLSTSKQTGQKAGANASDVTDLERFWCILKMAHFPYTKIKIKRQWVKKKEPAFVPRILKTNWQANTKQIATRKRTNQEAFLQKENHQRQNQKQKI